MKAVLSTVANEISVTYAHRSPANVTESDSNRLEMTGVGHVLVTVGAYSWFTPDILELLVSE